MRKKNFLKNYYEILEISPSADYELIRNSYKTLAKKYHPDICTSLSKKDAEDKFKLVNEAYDVLSDSEKREAYDNAFLPKPSSSQNYTTKSTNNNMYSSNSIHSNNLYNYDVKMDSSHYSNKKRTFNFGKEKIIRDRIILGSSTFLFILIVFVLVMSGIALDLKSTKNKNSIVPKTTIKADNTKGNITNTNINNYILLGDSSKKVISIMGNPIRMTNGRMIYKDSQIFLSENNKVTGWDNTNGNLKVLLYKKATLGSISLGTLRSEVANTKGTPLYLNKNVWIYSDEAYIFDKNGYVVEVKKRNKRNNINVNMY